MALIDDAKLIDEYLQWRAVQEVSAPDLTPQAFMRERVKEVAVDRIEDAIKLLDYEMSQDNMIGSRKLAEKVKAILEGSDGIEGEDREDSGQESDTDDRVINPPEEARSAEE